MAFVDIVAYIASVAGLVSLIVAAIRYLLVRKQVDWLTVGGVALFVVLTVPGLFILNRSTATKRSYPETSGGIAHTWTNYVNAGGDEGPLVASHQMIQVACRLTGFKVQDGNTWWYRIAESPWNDMFYVSADAFYNNGQTTGSLVNTPPFDPRVPAC